VAARRYRAAARHACRRHVLNSGAMEPRRDQLDGFYRGLKEAGFVPGQNVTIIKRGADDHYDRHRARGRAGS
jgi:hypothetical protein